MGLVEPFFLPISLFFCSLAKLGKKFPEAERERGASINRGDLCRVVEGGQTICCEELVFLPSGVAGVMTVEEEVVVPIDNHVLKVLEFGRDGGETVMLAGGRERFVDMVFSLTSRRMLWMTGGTCWRTSAVMMSVPSKEVVTHRWKMLFATHANQMRQRRMMMRSPRGPPRL